MSLDFLKQITVEDPSLMKKSSGGGGRRKQWNPTAANSIRIWKDGSVYPSADLVKRFSLEYGNKPQTKEEKASGNAFDVFSSEDFAIFKVPQTVILLNVAPKAAGKTDLFGSTTYNEDGTPKSTVMDQGSKTFGKDSFLGMIQKVYGVEVNEAGFIDLVFLGQDGETAATSFGLPNGKNICHVPKEVSRGTKAGEMSYARREDPQLFILYPLSLLKPEQDAANLDTKLEQTEEVSDLVAEEATA
jgi:hypothetical protein